LFIRAQKTVDLDPLARLTAVGDIVERGLARAVAVGHGVDVVRRTTSRRETHRHCETAHQCGGPRRGTAPSPRRRG
jgi:hypothetical protein